MTRADFDQINVNRIARGQKPLTWTESPSSRREPLPPMDTAAARLGVPTVTTMKKVKGTSKLEERFALLWQVNGGPVLQREFRFDPSRKWRADFAHEASRTLFEIEGGQWGTGKPCPACGQRKQGAHNRGKHFDSDAEKYLKAWRLGFAVVRLTGKLLTNETVADLVARLKKVSAEIA